MKKVININFQGRVVPIEESAYDMLKQYVESLRKFFANEEGRDEIINDIEGRIAELFSETLKKGSTCITDNDVNRIIDSMGRPEDFDDEEAKVKPRQPDGEEKQAQSSSYSHQAYSTGEPRRLYRDENNKILGGVCSGIANYLGIDPLIVRILMAVTIGVTFIPYLVLWVAVPSTASAVIGSQRKRLFRDPDDKIIAGVCSGLSQYFGVSIWIPRLLFLIPFFSFIFRFGHWGLWDFPHFLSISFSPGSLFIYIILWLVLPEAKTAADKLEMKGEKVDLNNIKNTIQGDMEGFKEKAEKFGNEIKERTKKMGQDIGERGKQFGSEAGAVAKRGGRGLGDLIILIFKIFAYFILGCVLFSIVISLFAVGVIFTGLLPLKDFILTDGWQEIFAWGTLILFIWVPVIGIVTFIIRRLVKIKGNSNLIRYTILSLWLVGLFCFIGLISSLRNDFRYMNTPQEQNIALSNPAVGKLEVTTASHKKFYYSTRRWFRMEPFADINDDSVFVQNVRIRVIKSNNDSFQVSVVKMANGSSRILANELASEINYTPVQDDTILMLDRGIAITPVDKFRNQHVILTIAVPVGKKIRIHENVGWDENARVNFGFDDDWNWRNYDDEDGAQNWRHDVEYIMTTKGLERTDRQKDDDSYNSSNDKDNTSNTLQEYKKSKEQLQKEYERKQKEVEELKKELDKPAVDSTRYHYRPEAPGKLKSSAELNIPNNDLPIGINDLLMTKFSI